VRLGSQGVALGLELSRLQREESSQILLKDWQSPTNNPGSPRFPVSGIGMMHACPELGGFRPPLERTTP
jgi:hypothetical protein